MRLFSGGHLKATNVEKLDGESRFIPNLQIALTAVQLREVKAAISHVESKKSSNIWFGPYSLTENCLSIQALDLLNVLSRFTRNAGTEIELFRLRKEAIDQLESLRRRARNRVKVDNIDSWLELYNKPWIGIDAPKAFEDEP